MSDLARALLEELAGDPEAVKRLREIVGPGDSERVLLTPAEAAAKLSVHPRTLVRAAAAGRVPGAVRAGSRWRFAADELRLDAPTGPADLPAQRTRSRPRRKESAGVRALRGKG